MRSKSRSGIWFSALCCLLLAAGCRGAAQPGPSASGETTAPEAKPVDAEVVAGTLAGLRALYQSREQDIRGRAVDGNFRLGAEGQFVPADISYSAAKIEALVDASRPVASRLDAGTDAVTVLIAAYRTTELPQFAIFARDVLDYLRTVLKEANNPAQTLGNFEAARVAPLETELEILETACGCPR